MFLTDFSGLDSWWNVLNERQKEEQRPSCMANCQNTCSAGGATMALVCDVGIGLAALASGPAGITVRAIVGVVGGAVGCNMLGDYYAGECAKKCEWRFR
jgi:hypothetical protein